MPPPPSSDDTAGARVTRAMASTTTSSERGRMNAPELTLLAIAKSLLAGGIAGGVCVRARDRACDAR